MNTKQTENPSILKLLLKILQGALIGLGAVLPGISGGVLSVVFGIYKTIMELLANPFRNFKTHVPKLLPYIIGAVIGFMGIANLLAFLLEKYPDPSEQRGGGSGKESDLQSDQQRGKEYSGRKRNPGNCPEYDHRQQI